MTHTQARPTCQACLSLEGLARNGCPWCTVTIFTSEGTFCMTDAAPIDEGGIRWPVPSWVPFDEFRKPSPAVPFSEALRRLPRCRPWPPTARWDGDKIVVAIQEWARLHRALPPRVIDWRNWRETEEESGNTTLPSAADADLHNLSREPFYRRRQWTWTGCMGSCCRPRALEVLLLSHDTPLSKTPTPSQVTKVFGSWSKALRAAGFEPRSRATTEARAAGPRPGRNRQMVTGDGFGDHLPGSVKHFNGEVES